MIYIYRSLQELTRVFHFQFAQREMLTGLASHLDLLDQSRLFQDHATVDVARGYGVLALGEV